MRCDLKKIGKRHRDANSGFDRFLMRILIKTLFLFLIVGIVSTCAQTVPGPCNNVSYGAGVTCISGAGASSGGNGPGGSNVAVSSWTVNYSPHCSGSACSTHALILTAYFCYDGISCSANYGLIDMTVSTTGSYGTHNPEPCFVESPHSPFVLSGFLPPTGPIQTVEQAMWVCESAPSGMTSISVNLPSASAFVLAPSVTEWTGLATSGNPWDVDAGYVGGTLVTQLTATTPVTNYSNELIYTYQDNTGDEVMAPIAPCTQALQWWKGNMNNAYLAPNAGTAVSCSAHWSGTDGWYATIGAIKTAQSQSKTILPPSGLTATVQ